MRSDRRILIVGTDTWLIGVGVASAVTLRPVSMSPEGTAVERARAVRASLDGKGRGDISVVLALPSRQCLAATIDVSGLPRRNRRRLMVYRLEEQLPLAAEDVAIDFIAGDHSAALGIATQSAYLGPLLDALHKEGISVQAVVPLAIIALQAAVTSGAVGDCQFVAWQDDGGHTDFFRLHDGRPSAWFVTDGSTAQLDRCLGRSANEPARPGRLWCGGNANGLAKLQSAGDVEVIDGSTGSMNDFAARFVATSDAQPWLDLRRNGLAARNQYGALRSSVTWVAVAALLCIVATCGSLLFRAHRYRQSAARDEAAEAQLFRVAFPDRPIPPSVLTRLESERRLAGGVAGAPTATPSRGATMILLRDVLARVPADVPLRISDLRLAEDALYVEGQVRSHADANTLAQALRQVRGVTFDPPKTEQLPNQGVSFTITASRSSPSRKDGGGAP